MKKLLLSFTALFCSLCNYAQSVDPNFGNGGTVAHLNNGSYFIPTLLPDGKIILSGNYDENNISKAVLLKLNVDGSLDQTFASGGVFTVDQYSNYDYYEAFSKVEVQSDGKLFFAHGVEFDNGIDPESMTINLMRLNANGTPDATFTSPWTGVTDFDNALYGFELLPSGKYLGHGENFLMRFNANGSLDTTYGVNGKRTVSFGIVRMFENGGNIYLDTYPPNNYNNRTFSKLLNETAGISASYNYGPGTVYQNNSNFFVFGNSELTKLNSNAALDTGFGTNGKITVSQQYISDMLFQAGGSVILYNNQSSGSGTNHMFTRINSNGTLSTGFGQGGTWTMSVPNSQNYSSNADNFVHPNGSLYMMFAENTGESFYMKRILLPNETLSVIDANIGQKVKIVENPVRNTLKLTGDLKNASIYDLSGKVVMKNLNGREFSVDALSSGIYYLNDQNDRGELIKMMFIKK
ncbi:T9SS type A sorting domain-containing protein [Chryseobacterium caseinilyticum]|uniref:T9SS type A sorting domain-containing protein n=1 Tax=Chryseobacterium caseinilyticum TaxID=2771428 RepID=A0ABR8ZFW7_9FLAO|nr:T9SS type A sorting domain-containing protein [Chryseobacterium caseinilyticum]MBD8083698.1 T9SS type A sorting domain-containing protein [Chryseobacterium caseinilyticum]